MTTVGTAEGWTRELDVLAARIAPRFGRAEERNGTTYHYDRQGRGTGRAQAR